MSISLKQMRMKKVASLDEGRMVGSVQTVYVDEGTNQLKSIQLSQVVWGGDQRWVRVEDIKRIGVDLIYIPNERVIRTGIPQGRSVDTLLGMSISSKDGKVMGILDDLKISSRLGKINKIRTSANEFISVDAQELVIGKDVILIQAKAKKDEPKRKATKKTPAYNALRQDLVKRTSKVLKRGEKLVKKTRTAMREMMEGQEADLTSAKRKRVLKKKVVAKKKVKSAPKKVAKQAVKKQVKKTKKVVKKKAVKKKQ